SFEQRTEIRAEAIRTGVWPPKTSEFIVSMQSEIFLPAPFSPPLEPRQVGPLFEMRTYTYAPGAIPGVIERWAPKIDARVKLSPLIGAWYSELGGLNKWVHIWAYKDAVERQRVRAEAMSQGIWPPPSAGPGLLLKQENKLVMPASFSPLR
ncbi:MAG TPA: NIPSNAP family protein, partial [Rhodopila sp.]